MLDTNVFKLLVDEKYLRGIIERCDHIYVAKCAWREARGVHAHLINMLRENAKMLSTRGKWHLEDTENMDVRPFRSIWQSFTKCFKGGSCDKEIAKLAFYRRLAIRQDVVLVSEDYHLISMSQLLGNYNVSVLSYRDERFRAVSAATGLTSSA